MSFFIPDVSTISSTHIESWNLHLWEGGGTSYRPSGLMWHRGREAGWLAAGDEPPWIRIRSLVSGPHGCFERTVQGAQAVGATQARHVNRLCIKEIILESLVPLHFFNDSVQYAAHRMIQIHKQPVTEQPQWVVCVCGWVAWVLNIHPGWHPLQAKMDYGSRLPLLWVRSTSSHRKQEVEESSLVSTLYFTVMLSQNTHNCCSLLMLL